MSFFRNEKQYHGNAISNYTLTSTQVAAAPTMAEHNALQADVAAINTRLNEVLVVLRNMGSI